MKSKDTLINRRNFLGIVTGGIATAAVISPSAESFAATFIKRSKRPNIVMVLSDDHSYHDAGCYGNNAVRTPCIDQLAGEGMKFDNAFTVTAMCTPSRSACYTGLYPHRNGAHPNHSQIREGIKTLPAYFKDLGYRVVLAGKTHIRPRESFPFEYIKLEEVDTFLKGVGDEPFCLIIATNDPHGPFPKPPPGEEYNPNNVIIPPYIEDTQRTRENIAAYYYAVTSLDNQVGMHRESLRKYGFEENTFFLYAGDHGHGFPFAKWTLYDAGIKVPMVAYWQGHIEPGSITGAMVSFVDILPTFIECAGGSPVKTLDGKSFLPVLEGRRAEHHDVIFATHTTHNINFGSHFYPIRAIRTKKYKYINNLNYEGTFNCTVTRGEIYNLTDAQRKAREGDPAVERAYKYQHRPEEELYDMENDPFELKNIIEEKSELAEELRGQLVEWMTQQNDPLLYLMSRRQIRR